MVGWATVTCNSVGDYNSEGGVGSCREGGVGSQSVVVVVVRDR